MKVVEYTAQYNDALCSTMRSARMAASLQNQSFVRHFYLGYPDSRLYLLVDDHGSVLATLGSETVSLQVAGKRREAHILSHTYSVKPCAFPFLLLHWMKLATLGITFPGNVLMNELVSKQKRWRRIPGLYTYWLNWSYPAQADDPLWKRFLRPIARRLMRVDPAKFARKMGQREGGGLSLIEERHFTDEMVVRDSGFGLRLQNSAAHLNWRFSTTLDYVKYRIFRLAKDGATTGYVVLAEWPGCLIVSHCDGDDPVQLAFGVLLAIAKVNQGPHRYRKTILSSMHPAMSSVFRRFGFRPKKSETPFYMASFDNDPVPSDMPRDWLVNLDFADSGIMLGMFDQK